MEVKDVKNAADVITADTNIIEAVQAHPEIMQVFADYGLGCIGCMAAQFETIVLLKSESFQSVFLLPRQQE